MLDFDSKFHLQTHYKSKYSKYCAEYINKGATSGGVSFFLTYSKDLKRLLAFFSDI